MLELLHDPRRPPSSCTYSHSAQGKVRIIVRLPHTRAHSTSASTSKLSFCPGSFERSRSESHREQLLSCAPSFTPFLFWVTPKQSPKWEFSCKHTIWEVISGTGGNSGESERGKRKRRSSVHYWLGHHCGNCCPFLSASPDDPQNVHVSILPLL